MPIFREACVGDVVPLSLKGDQLLGPQGTEHSNLLLNPAASVVEPLTESLVLHIVPADAHAQPETAAAEHVHLRRLLGDQGRLPLGQDQDVRHQL